MNEGLQAMSEEEVNRRAFLGKLSLPLILAVPSTASATAPTAEASRHRARQLLTFFRELGLEENLGTAGLSEEDAVIHLAGHVNTNTSRYVSGGGESTYSGGRSDDTAQKHAD